MEVHEAAFNALKALRDDDTGSTGLLSSNNDANQRTQGFVLAGDPAAEGAIHPPYFRVVINTTVVPSQGQPAERVFADLHLFTDNREALTREFAIVDRCKAVFYGVAPGSQGDWTFSQISWRGTVRGAPEEGRTHRVIRLMFVASEATAGA